MPTIPLTLDRAEESAKRETYSLVQGRPQLHAFVVYSRQEELSWRDILAHLRNVLAED
jgi:hypothetical protein